MSKNKQQIYIFFLAGTTLKVMCIFKVHRIDGWIFFFFPQHFNQHFCTYENCSALINDPLSVLLLPTCFLRLASFDFVDETMILFQNIKLQRRDGYKKSLESTVREVYLDFSSGATVVCILKCNIDITMLIIASSLVVLTS